MSERHDPNQTVDSAAGQPQELATGEHVPQPTDVPPLLATPDFRAGMQPDTVIANRYTLMEKIGEGGMGEVWIAQQTEPVKRRVALKLIKTGMDSRSVLARFEQERQALAIMDHPSIARVLDGGATPTGQPFFVMELVDGLPLTKFCDEKKLTPKDRLALFVPICQAVQHAHQKGIVHRDLKPANILVTLIDGRPVPKVIDFGVAKATGEKLTDEAMDTQAGAIVGTLEYMSPEQASFTGEDIDTRADIYSLGVILYELLTGLRPIDAKRLKKAALVEMVRIIQEEEPPKPSTRLSTHDAHPSLAALRQTEPKRLTALLRGELDWVVMKCLEKQRDRRYETANALSRDIQRYLADEPVEARPPSLGYRFGKLVRRNRAMVSGVAAVAAALLIGIAIATWQAVRATRAENEERLAKIDAERLADENADLAKEERLAKNQARKLAADNADLAKNEGIAKNQAIDATRERERELARARAFLFTSQMARVARVRDTRPFDALDLLYDLEACPIDLRDPAWCFAENACKRRLVAEVPVGNAATAGMNALSPDGKLLATARFAGMPKGRVRPMTVTLLEVPSGKVKGVLPEVPDAVGMLVFSPDSSKLALVASGDVPPPFPDGKGGVRPRPAKPDKVFLWDIAKEKLVATLEGHTDRVHALAFSPNNSLLATGSMDSTTRLWEVSTAKEKHVLKEHTAEVSALAFTADGKRLVTASLDNSIKTWDVDSSKCLATWSSPLNTDSGFVERMKFGGRPNFNFLKRGLVANAVVALAFSPDGTTLAAGNANSRIEIWDVAKGLVRSLIHDAGVPFSGLFFHRDGKSVLGYTESGTKQWDINNGQVLLDLRDLFPVGFSSQLSLLAIRSRLDSGGKVDLLDLDVPLERARFALGNLDGSASALAFNKIGNLLAVGAGKNVLVWDVPTGKLRHTLTGHKNQIGGLAFSPDGRTLVSSGGFDGSPFGMSKPSPDDLRLWDSETGKSLGTIEVNQEITPALAFSPDGATLAAIHWKLNPLQESLATVTLWDMKSRKLRDTLSLPPADGFLMVPDAAAVAFHPTQGTLATAAGRYLQFWDLKSRKVKQQFVIAAGRSGLATNQILSMALSPDGKTVVACSMTASRGASQLDVWEVRSGELLHRVRGTNAGVLRFSSDSKTLLTADTTTMTVGLWDAATMQARATFAPGPRENRSVRKIALALSPDGQILASAAAEQESGPGGKKGARGEVKLWDLSRSPTRIAFSGQSAPTFQFSPDSKTLLIRENESMRFWDLERNRFRPVTNTKLVGLAFVFSPDGRTLAGGGAEMPDSERANATMGWRGGRYTGVVNLWDARTGAVRKRFETGKGTIVAMAYSPDGKNLALVHSTHPTAGEVLDERSVSLEIWDLENGRPLATFPLANTTGEHLAFTPDGSLLAFSSYDRTIHLMDLKKGIALPPLKEPPPDWVDQARKGLSLPLVPGTGADLRDLMRFSKDGTRLVTRRFVKPATTTVWDWRAGKEVKEPIPELFADPETSVSPDGRYELKRFPFRTELIDRAVKAPAIAPRQREQ